MANQALDKPTPTTPAPAAESKPAVAIALIPTTIDEAWRLAQFMAKSELVPKAYKDKPHDVLVAIMYGAELGLTPAHALSSVAVVNGRPGLYAEGLMAVIMASPLYQSHDEYFLVNDERRDRLTDDDLKLPTTTAVCVFERRGAPKPFTAWFSVADARRGKLTTKPGPWAEYPQLMLKYRARSFAARDAFPDLLRGVRAAEELADTPADPPTVPDVRRLSDRPPVERSTHVGTVTGVTELTDAAVLSGGVTIDIPIAFRQAIAELAGTSHTIRAVVRRGPADELILESFDVVG